MDRRAALQLWWDPELGAVEHLARRLDGARGVRLVVLLEARDGISGVLVFGSSATRDAYAVWAPRHLLTALGRGPVGLVALDAHTQTSGSTTVHSL
jgi:hypothetical protein